MTSAAMPRRQAAWRSSAVRAARAGPPVHSCGDRWAREGMPSASKRPWSSAGPRARTSWPRSTRRRARAMSGFTLPPPAHVTSRNRAVGVVTNWLSLSVGQAEPLPSGSCSTTCVCPTGTPTGRPPIPAGRPGRGAGSHWQDRPRDQKPRRSAGRGAFRTQQVGPGSVKELAEALRGPLPRSTARSPERAVAAARDAGLVVVDLREESLRTVFYDVGAVVYFLRLVVWIVPDFSVERHRRQLESLHEVMEAEGSFVTYARRFLIEAPKST